MPISCSLARNAPLSSFVGLLWVLCGPLRYLVIPIGNKYKTLMKTGHVVREICSPTDDIIVIIIIKTFI